MTKSIINYWLPSVFAARARELRNKKRKRRRVRIVPDEHLDDRKPVRFDGELWHRSYLGDLTSDCGRWQIMPHEGGKRFTLIDFLCVTAEGVWHVEVESEEEGVRIAKQERSP